jgi:hypothetical protein
LGGSKSDEANARVGAVVFAANAEGVGDPPEAPEVVLEISTAAALV